MKTVSSLLQKLCVPTLLLLSACGGDGGAPGATAGVVTHAPIITNHHYHFEVVAPGVTFEEYSSVNLATTADNYPIAPTTPVDATPIILDFFGKDAYVQFSHMNGLGTLTVTFTKDGVLDSVKTQTLNGTAIQYWLNTGVNEDTGL